MARILATLTPDRGLECLARDDFVGDNLVNVFAAHQLFRKRLFKAGRLALVVEDPYKNDLKSFGARLSSFLIAFSPSTLASCRSWASVGWWTEQQRG